MGGGVLARMVSVCLSCAVIVRFTGLRRERAMSKPIKPPRPRLGAKLEMIGGPRDGHRFPYQGDAEVRVPALKSLEEVIKAGSLGATDVADSHYFERYDLALDERREPRWVWMFRGVRR